MQNVKIDTYDVMRERVLPSGVENFCCLLFGAKCKRDGQEMKGM